METLDFGLSEEHKMLRQMVRDFAREKLAAIADAVDQKEEFPIKSFKRIAERGFWVWALTRNTAELKEIRSATPALLRRLPAPALPRVIYIILKIVSLCSFTGSVRKSKSRSI